MSWSYLAGFLDGDGWITCSQSGKKNLRYIIGFTQKSSNEWFMKEICNFLENEEVTYTYSTRTVISPKVPTPVKMINIIITTQHSVKKAAHRLLPHLVLKKVKAEECLLYVSERLDKRGNGVNVLKKQTTNFYWKEEEVNKLLKLHKEGHGNISIASKLGRSVNSIAQYLRRLKLKRN